MRTVSFDIAAGTAGTYAGTVALDRDYLHFATEWVVGTMGTATDATLVINHAASTVNVTLLTITNGSANAWYRPRPVEHDTAGAALTTRTLDLVPRGDLILSVTGAGTAATTGKANVYLMDARWA